MANSSSSIIELLDSNSVKKRDAKDSGLLSPFSSCCMTAPNPALLASQIMRSGQSLLIWFNVVTFVMFY